jgi:hypothetical protein
VFGRLEAAGSANLGFRSPGMESSGDGGDEGAGAPSAAGMGSPGPASAPAAVAGGSSGAGASGSGGKPPVKRVMKTPYQLEVLERTYTGSSAAQESECFGFVFASCRSELCACFSWGFDLPCVVLVQRTRTQTRRSGRSCRCSWGSQTGSCRCGSAIAGSRTGNLRPKGSSGMRRSPCQSSLHRPSFRPHCHPAR